MRKVKQSTAKNVMVLMVDSTDHVTGKAGLTLTITASKNGGAFASISPTVTERGSGWYSLALTASHTDTLGDLALHITGAAADPADLVLLVEGGATDVDTSTRLATAGYTAPDNATIAAIAGFIDTEIAAILAAVDTEVGAIKAKTDGLPADTSATLTALTALVDDLESRLTAVRAGLLDNLSNLDAAITSRLATAGYTAPDNASITAIKAKTDLIPAAPFDAADRTLLQNIEQEALGARTLNLATGVETVSRTGRTDKTRTLYKDAAKTLPVDTDTDPVLGTGELA